MRRTKRATESDLAWQLLSTVDFLQLATVTAEGAPVMRTLNGVVVDDWILFHGAIAGEKSDCLDQPAVVASYQVIADIPSTFVDPEKACPATTYFRSVQAKGTLRNVDEDGLKRRMLDALMEKYQPEGGYVPFSETRGLYDKDLKSVRVFGMQVQSITGKASLGQDRPAERTGRVVQGLWNRGAPGDMEAIEAICELSPEARPADWRLQELGLELVVHATPDWIKQHAQLLEGQYWRKDSSQAEIEAAIAQSPVWIGAVDEENQLQAAARATADRSWVANIYDVVVAPAWRKRGVGHAVMRLLQEHPLVRDCPRQKLGTRDAMSFYERFGFKTKIPDALGFDSHPMVRFQPPTR